MTDIQDIEDLVEKVREIACGYIDSEFQNIKVKITDVVESDSATDVYKNHNIIKGNIFAFTGQGAEIVMRTECFFLSGEADWAKTKTDEHKPGLLVKSIIERTKAKHLRENFPVLYFETLADGTPSIEPVYTEEGIKLALIKVSNEIKNIIKDNENDITQSKQEKLEGFIQKKAACLKKKHNIIIETTHPYSLLRPMLNMSVQYLYLIPTVLNDVTLGGIILNVKSHLSAEEIKALCVLSKWALIPIYISRLCGTKKDERETGEPSPEYFPPSLLNLVTQVHNKDKDPYNHFDDLISVDLDTFLTEIQGMAKSSVKNYVLKITKSMWTKIVPRNQRKIVEDFFDFYKWHEQIFFAKEGYRDHLIHQMLVYLTGLCLIRNQAGYIDTCILAFKNYFSILADYKISDQRKQEAFKEKISEYFDNTLQKEHKERLIRWNWFITATFHDMAYPVEMSEFWISYCIGHLFNPEESANIGEQISEALESKEPLRSFGSGIFSEIQGRLLERVDHIWIKKEGEQTNWLAKYLDYFPKELAPGSQISVGTLMQLLTGAEHGLFSSFMLYSKFLSQQEANTTPYWLTFFEKGTDFSNDALFHLSLILSIVPIALHSQKVWSPLSLKMSYNNFPSAFILTFCDLLQESNREELFLNELHISDDIELRSIDAKEHYATGVLTYRETIWKQFSKKYGDFLDKTHELTKIHWGKGPIPLTIFYCSFTIFNEKQNSIDKFTPEQIEDMIADKKIMKIQLGGA